MDPRPKQRVRDPDLLHWLHGRWRECVICGDTGRLSLHHIHKHPRDDLEANLVMLCGDGVRGCHGDVEAHKADARRNLAAYILIERMDSVEYLIDKIGASAFTQWFEHEMS